MHAYFRARDTRLVLRHTYTGVPINMMASQESMKSIWPLMVMRRPSSISSSSSTKYIKTTFHCAKNDASYMYTFTTTALYFLKSQDCSNFDAVCLDMCLLLISGPWAVLPGKKDTRRHRKALETPRYSRHTLQVIRKAAMFCLC